MHQPSPHSPYTPPQSPLSPDDQGEKKGSFLFGLILPLLILFVGYAVVGVLTNLLMTIPRVFLGSSSGSSFILSFIVMGLALLPIAALIWSIVYFVKRGKTRTVAGIATSSGLILLLIAACFGFFILNPLNFH